MRNPFTTSPVWGDRFFGRTRIIDDILYGPRDSIWIVGLRRVGKTSLLKQLDHLGGKREPGYLGLYIDLEGCRDPMALKERLLMKLELSTEKLEASGVKLTGLPKLDFVGLLQELLQRTHQAKKKLLLLCDEAEELIEMGRQGELETLSRWRGLLQEGDYIRTVLCSTQRLQELKNFTQLTSPFLNGFEPPIYLAHLPAAEAAPLIEQLRKTGEAPVRLIWDATGGHPFLTQVLCMKYWEDPDLPKAIDSLEHNAFILGSFLSEDFQPLAPPEQQILLKISERQPIAEAALRQCLAMPSSVLKSGLASLTNLGLIKEAGQAFTCANAFFKSWLEGHSQSLWPEAGAPVRFDDVTVDWKKREVYKNGQEVRLTKKEFDILKELIGRKGEVVDRFDLLGWSPEKDDDGHEFTTRTIDMLIARIRKKLDDDPAQPRYIESTRGIGYKWIAKARLSS